MKVWSWGNIFLHPDYYYNRGTAVRTWAMEDIRFRKELSSDPYANKTNIVLAVAGVSLVIIGAVIMGVYGRASIRRVIGGICILGAGSVLIGTALTRTLFINSVRNDREERLLAELLSFHDEEKLSKRLKQLQKQQHEWVHQPVRTGRTKKI